MQLKQVTLFILTAALAFGQAWAEPEEAEKAVEIEPVYQVEFIVIRPRFRDGLNFEEWPEERPQRNDDEAFSGNAPAALSLESLPLFAWVTEDDWDLPSTLKRLSENGNYEVLMHRSWRQQTTPRANATAYQVKLPFSQSNQPTLAADKQSPTNNTVNQTRFEQTDNGSGYGNRFSPYSAEPIPEPPEAGLVGQVAFSKARYLHLNIDLLMSEYDTKSRKNSASENWDSSSLSSNGGGYGLEATSVSDNRYALAESLGLQAVEKDPVKHYHLKESRRIKTEVTHYFDHPAFAVLAHVRRLSDEELAAHQATLIGQSIQLSE